MQRYSPFATNMVGIVLSMLIAVIVGTLVGRLAFFLSGYNEFYFYFGTVATAVFLACTVYFGGVQGKRKIRVGYTGVPTFLGQRQRWFLLREGHHWLPPFIMGIKAVLTKIDVSEQIIDGDPKKLDKVISLDDIAMQARYVITHEVLDPYTNLNVNHPIESLHEIATPVFRQAIARHKSTELVREELKNQIGHEITVALRRGARRLGYGNLEAQVSVMLYSPKLEEALEKIRIEDAERVSETTNAETAIRLVKKVIEETKMTPQEAAAFIQIEREKTKSNRTIIGIENSDKIAKALTTILEQFLAKGENT